MRRLADTSWAEAVRDDPACGLSAALLWLFAATAAKSSSVAPDSFMYVVAMSA